MRGGAVAAVMGLLAIGMAGCLGGMHVPACGGTPVDHEGVRFAWPPHLASDRSMVSSANCLVLRTGAALDLIIVAGESGFEVEHPAEGRVRLATASSGPARGVFEAPVQSIHNNGPDSPLSYLAIDWADRPSALVMDGYHVHWVLPPSRLSADGDGLEVAHELMDGLGIERFDGKVNEVDLALPLSLTETMDGSFETTPGAGTDRSHAAAMQRVRLACDGCTSRWMLPAAAPATWAQKLEWTVDPNGDVAWVSAQAVPAWDHMDVSSLEERDAAVETFAQTHRLELGHPVSRLMMLDRDPWELYWKVDVRYVDHEPKGQGGVAIMHLDALSGNWTVEVDGGLTDANGTTTYPLSAAYKEAGSLA